MFSDMFWSKEGMRRGLRRGSMYSDKVKLYESPLKWELSRVHNSKGVEDRSWLWWRISLGWVADMIMVCWYLGLWYWKPHLKFISRDVGSMILEYLQCRNKKLLEIKWNIKLNHSPSSQALAEIKLSSTWMIFFHVYDPSPS